MFQIRSEQYDAMSKRAMDNFEQRAIAYLYESHPECVVEAGEEAFNLLVKASIQHAMKNGINLEICIVQYVQLDLESTPRLEDDLEVKWNQVLSEQDLEQVRKIEFLKALVYGLPGPSQSDPDDEE